MRQPDPAEYKIWFMFTAGMIALLAIAVLINGGNTP